ncbi:MAG: hypothetical protein F4056_10490 [Chloroflexi bacterium]|nr:hypothetical protein [Chloroflexota bacterium]
MDRDPSTAPSYNFSLGYIVRWLFSVAVLRRRRRLGPDSREMLRGAQPRPRVVGIEQVPREGPCIVVMNHYERPGLRVWWCAALVGAALEAHRGGDPPVHWLITDRFEGFSFAGLPMPDRLMAWLLGKIGDAYGLLLVARPDAEVRSRSSLLREAREILREDSVLGITPEAASGSGPELAAAWPGSGAALSWLSSGATPLVPVAVRDAEDGALLATFGAPFTLERMNDEEGARAVMGPVAALLPPELRGVYSED